MGWHTDWNYNENLHVVHCIQVCHMTGTASQSWGWGPLLTTNPMKYICPQRTFGATKVLCKSYSAAYFSVCIYLWLRKMNSWRRKWKKHQSEAIGSCRRRHGTSHEGKTTFLRFMQMNILEILNLFRLQWCLSLWNKTCFDSVPCFVYEHWNL